MSRKLAIALLLAAPVAASAQQALRFPDPDVGEAALERRRQEQVATAEGWRVRHDFAFRDVLPSSGIDFVHHVVDDAARSYQAAHYDHGNGVAVADVNGDGNLDLYFVNQVGSNGLFLGHGDGTFENATERAGVGLAGRIGVAASFADVDNDGDPDLFATTVRMGNVLFENDGSGVFTDVTERAGVGHVGHSSGAVFLDYDGDGLLDLFVANVGDYTYDEVGADGAYRAREDAFDGHLFPDRFERSLLYRNLGDGRFEEVAERTGLLDDGWSGDAALVDFVGDGHPDLYVLNMQGSDHYWENQGDGTFAERTTELFPRTPWGAMGVKSFDIDADGDLDLLLTDMHSDMTEARDPGREDSKHAFADERFYQERYAHILGNALYVNDGAGGFVESSDALGVETYWPWGFSVGDLNADGWEDVFVTQSMNYPFRYQTDTVRLNDLGRGFLAAEFVLGVEPRRDGRVRQPWFELDCDGADAHHLHCQGRSGRLTVLGTLGSRSSAILDLDADGDLDIVTAEFNSAPQVLVSDLAQRGGLNWIQVRLEGVRSNRDGLGARVELTAGGRTQVRLVDGKSGYLSQSSMPESFGLGEAESVDRIVVRWPSGIVQTIEGPLAGNRRIAIREE